MKEINKKAPVMVTGATGYVAGWLVKLLLDNGFTVHAPIRNPNDKNKTQYLDKLAASAPGTLRYFEADLLREGSYDKAMQGCELVFHTASPFALKVKDAQRDLIDPAIEGTRNILNAVNKTASVKRVVLTSSVAAMYGDNKDLQQLPHHSITEEVWNTTSSVDHQPYSYSKTMAEKEAWKMQNQQQRWDLVVINPSLVMGPGISPEITSESFKIIKQLGDGTMKMGAPDYEIGLVDVRDVAQAHFAAGFTPTAKGRYIISGHNSGILEISKMLRDAFGDAYPFPTRKIPKFLLWLIGPLAGFPRKMISRNMGYPFRADNSKSIEGLGMSYRPAQESVVDFFSQMIEKEEVRS
ncbi:MAG: NAD-dependent epimerase/dehydratase family protein [Bacteroidales bacterium]|jgi:dihydroflavonol-4-reductase|nr:NAD-dependent epimerase/dehydratase family protein [Bacteroidales bacterium]NCU34554.1 NAD-dependent epimerase/dehydratase family protein [Candidatus Falkowbacteria bacterium]MDD2631930.1 NAD-dependent epimerase/dehydratase family protein [Bacteroidales bacterium]MDD3132476.1 NAD-dependent epimerase/dehydratase family protein [Bacteroidales bacterium]MDD3527410.1 NAD-dependent epimerase/dehydratase family protein [Bacteroidales bacterium]